MTTKNISLKEKSYKRLKKEKSEGESFSDVVIRLTEDSKNDFSNLISEGARFDWEKIKESRRRKKEDKKREKLLSRH